MNVDTIEHKHFEYEKMGNWAYSNYERKYALKENGHVVEDWPDTAYRVTTNVLGALGYKPGDEEFEKIYQYIVQRKFIPGGRYLYAAGKEMHQVCNCYLVFAEDSREGWAELLKKAAMILQLGGGIGVDYSKIREEGAPIRKTGGTASGPLSLMQMVNEIGRGVMEGGSRRSAIIALLDWDHPDIHKFIHIKDWSDEIKKAKERDFNHMAHMDMTNISINLDDEFFYAIDDKEHPKHEHAVKVYDDAVRNMISTGEPGFSINTTPNSHEKLRNPCGEVVSGDDSDVCNLGSINLAKVENQKEMKDIVKYATLFLLAGTEYTDLPYEKVGEVKDKNRRLGLGLMGIHEWLLKNGYNYGPADELEDWLKIYQTSSEHATDWALQHDLSNPIATRAIAPTGTIGILGETTTGIEPIFCVAYKRRYLDNGSSWHYQYVIDPTAKRMIEDEEIPPSEIQDAYQLSYNVERRVAFQAWIQEYVDQGVSSTINLPYPITEEKEVNDFKEMLLPYLPKLRGITAYPDGTRGGQPLVPSIYEEAIQHEGVVFEEDIDASCRNGVCGA